MGVNSMEPNVYPQKPNFLSFPSIPIDTQIAIYEKAKIIDIYTHPFLSTGS